MFRVFSCLTNEHDLRLVMLAGAICLLASFVAISLFRRAQAATGTGLRNAWIGFAGAAGGCGIWSFHFIAMLAYDAVVPVAYDVGLTAISLALAMGFTAAGLYVATTNGSRWAAAAGGTIIGAGIAAMHYTGMSALDLPGHIHWSRDLVTVSVVLGLVFGAAAIVTAVSYSGIAGTAVATLLLTLATLSHHFVAMGAIQIVPDPTVDFAQLTLSPSQLALSVAAAAMAVLGISLISAIADSHLSTRAQIFARERAELIEGTEEKLREQNLLLDTALNNMGQGLCMFNADEEVVVINRQFLEMYRLSPQVVKRGCKMRRLIQHRKEVGLLDADPEEYYRSIMADIHAGKTTTWQLKTADGRLVQAFNQPMPGGGWVTTHEDVTEQRRAEQRLSEQKLQLDAALNYMSQGLVMFDRESRLMLWNRRYLEIYSFPPDSIKPGITFQELLQLRKETGTFVRDPDVYANELRAALAQGKSLTLTPELGDGRIICIENHGTADGGWVATHEDITARRRAEAQTREQKLQLDTALNNMSQGLNMFEASGRLVVCNERYLQMYRLSRETVKPGCTIEDLIAARIRSGTFFAADPTQYAAELTEAMRKRLAGSTTMELTDGRIIAVISRPTPDGNGWVVTHEDITERRRTEMERDRSQAFANMVIENVPSTIIVKDARTLRYVLVNRAGEEYYGISRDMMVGKRADEMFSEAEARTIAEHDKELLETGEPQFFDERPVVTPSGESRISSTTRMPIRDSHGQMQYLLTMIDDRTMHRRAEAQIARLVHHDLLTGLPNRSAFTACLDATIETAAKESHSFALMSLDFDRFKDVNDVYGHAAGDELLRQMSKRLQAAVGGAFLSRLGGDEFVVIATDGKQPAAAEAMADRIIVALREDISVHNHEIRTGVSIGVAIFPADGSDTTTLIGNADAALYRAKAQGGGAFRFFEADMDQRLRERRALQQELRNALERNELMLYYQPQARIDGEIIGFEALVRWRHPNHGIISPNVFIPLAEESGLIVQMGEWIMREACREAASWSKPLQIGINLSPVQFRDGDLPNLVHKLLLETGLKPQRLEFEVTEGVLIDDFSRAVSILRRLKALGAHIAMDDFGTGYSSLSYLQSFPFDKIKIDQAFISNLERNKQSAAIVRAVIGLARGLELPVLAEGVETEEQRAFLAKESCDEIQGFLIGKPRPIADYAEMTGAPAARPRTANGKRRRA